MVLKLGASLYKLRADCHLKFLDGTSEFAFVYANAVVKTVYFIIQQESYSICTVGQGSHNVSKETLAFDSRKSDTDTCIRVQTWIVVIVRSG